LFYLIEEFVEVNHQIGHRKEETVKRIKSDEVRAKSKAMQGCICISNDSGVQSKKSMQVWQKSRVVHTRNTKKTHQMKQRQKLLPQQFA
jgi:hypothetical protein